MSQNRFNLTPSQEAIQSSVLLSIQNNEPVTVLNGNAGVGKTYLLNSVSNACAEFIGGSIAIMAPTNKALSILSEKIDNHSRYKFLTVHKGLGLRHHITKAGKETFIRGKRMGATELAGCGLFIVDECSMLNENLMDFLLDYETPILFVGDDKQINPVKEIETPVFNAGFPTYTLTEIIRQGNGNPIIDLSRNLKQVFSNENNVIDGKGYLFSENLSNIIEKLAETNGTNERKYIAWRNKTVNWMNYAVRKRLYGDMARFIEVGETVIFDKPFMRKYHTNQELLVESSEEVTLQIEFPQEGSFFHEKNNCIHDPLIIPFQGYKVNGELDVLHENEKFRFLNAAKVIKKQCINNSWDWKSYYHLFNQTAQLKHNHAITVHKSQGSTYQEAVVNVKDLMTNPNVEERTRLLYTAVTRPSDLLILNPHR